MGGIRPVALILAGLLLAAPASAGTGSELRGVIQRTEQLRGLGTTRPLAVSTVDAKGMRRVVLLAEVGAQPVGRERVVSLLPDALGRTAAKDVDEVPGSE